MNEDLVDLSALTLSTLIASRDVSCVEVVTAHLDRMRLLEPALHALVTRVTDDQVLAEAEARDESLRAGPPSGWMHGLPHAVKDLVDLRGLPTTFGLLDPASTAAAADDESFVERIRKAGAVFVGKTNTSELGVGSHTYNQIGPTTGNVADPSASAGGSSGGAAVAVAAGYVPVADGSDFMGSLRNPPGWNGVLGFRPSPGVVLERGEDPGHPGFGVSGPIARTVGDLRSLLQTMAGSAIDLGHQHLPPAATPRVRWLDGICESLPFESGVVDVCREAVSRWSPEAFSPSFEDEALSPDALWQTWLVIRHDAVGGWASSAFSEDQVARMKPEVQWEIEGFRHLTAGRRRAAAAAIGRLRVAVAGLFEDVDLLVLPTAQVWPFPSEQSWPASVGGVAMDTYHRWMQVTTFATLAGLPVAAVPAGRNEHGHHIGLQVIGRPGGDAELLRWVGWAEQRELFSVAAPTEAVATPARDGEGSRPEA